MKYLEIKELSDYSERYKMKAIPLAGNYLANDSSFPLIQLFILDEVFEFYVDDEYEDLDVENNLLSICIALRVLESYDYAEDYLIWCTQHGFDASIEEVRVHFKNLGEINSWFQKNGIQIKSFISDYDFELNAGAAQYLREHFRK